MTTRILHPQPAPKNLAVRAIASLRDATRAVAWPPLVQLLLRLALAVPFFKSGLLKWNGVLRLNDNAVALFESFELHLPGGPYAYPAPAVMAFIAASFEVLLPVLLVIGLGTRLAAAALLGMTLVIQLTVPDGWPIHLTWAAMALALMAHGAGPASLDHALASRWPRSATRAR
ncbi:DoxX family protein [Piscinibacter koreensis]|uniref:DoxX family protein n=1 Tax=Piscinibacter koreensis TaxID=2742824 RepID=A0A7Y6NP57_9BURK|nr:DoxX family protein [Schlegelella koreensis]NUZ06790.1 DoxX family protein [Schlegelella koreensis]